MPTKYKPVQVNPDHPLKPPSSGYVYEHRLVLWEHIGPGTHPCHHCGEPVTWSPGKGATAGVLVVDHLDDNGRNNEISNLVPSCITCNKKRTPKKTRVRDDELYCIVRGKGTRVRAMKLTCEECGDDFLTPRRSVKVLRFCSRSCSARHNQNKRVAAMGGTIVNSRSIRDDEPWVLVKGKGRTRAAVKHCEFCGAEYRVALHYADKSRYCGKPCKYAGLGELAKVRKKAKTNLVNAPR